jgi:hypothetical protein
MRLKSELMAGFRIPCSSMALSTVIYCAAPSYATAPAARPRCLEPKKE